MTAPNSDAVQKCIRGALKDAKITAKEVDIINGHLTATIKDPVEIENWSIALGRKGDDFPYVNSLKSMVGHCLAAAGSIESVAAVLQLKENFIFPSINCEDVHPRIAELIDINKIPNKVIYQDVNVVAKASFGFGDVNACVIFKKY
jgi:3-oxoacyl-(acyl-carrier-protein) synthase